MRACSRCIGFHTGGIVQNCGCICHMKYYIDDEDEDI
jgi:hypothetical protein